MKRKLKYKLKNLKIFFLKQNEKTLLAIIYDLDSYKSKQFINNENENKMEINDKEKGVNINNNEKIDELLMNYQNCLLSIDI